MVSWSTAQARLGVAVFRLAAILGLAGSVVIQMGRFSASADFFSVALMPLACLIVLTLFGSAWRRDWLAAAAALIALAMTGPRVFEAFDAAAPRIAPAGHQLRVVTVNAYHDNADPAALRRTIERLAPDIVMIQEADGSARAEIARLLPGYFRVPSCADPACSLVIVSRWPATRWIPVPRDAGPLPDLLVAKITTPFGPLSVVTAHLPRPYIVESRVARALLVDAASAQAPGPVLIAGDFNMPIGSFGIAQFATETGTARAERWIATYPANEPLPAFAAIDHVFVGGGLRVQDCERLPDVGSDHYGLVCELSSGPDDAHGRGATVSLALSSSRQAPLQRPDVGTEW